MLVDAVSTSARVLTIRPVTPLRRLSGPWDAERFIEQVRGDEPELASYLRIEERELEAGGLN